MLLLLLLFYEFESMHFEFTVLGFRQDGGWVLYWKTLLDLDWLPHGEQFLACLQFSTWVLGHLTE